MNEDVKSVFAPAPMISFPSARKLSSYLVRATLYPLEKTVSSVQMNRNVKGNGVKLVRM